MKNNRTSLAIKSFLYIVGLFHFVAGICGLLSENLYRAVAYYGWHATLELTPQLASTSKLLCAYMVGFSLMVLCVGYNPVKYRVFLIVAFVATCLEFLYSAFFFAHLNEIFHISVADNVSNLIVSLLLQIGFLICFYKTKNLHDIQQA